MRIHYRKVPKLNLLRTRRGKGFQFLDQTGSGVSDEDRERILKMVIPPAWKEVFISSDPLDHIQAVGVDERGRKQYIYHPEWVRQNQEHKFSQLVAFGEVLPSLREVVSSHMRQHSLSHDRVVATVVWLLEHTFIRVGNKEYAKENQSYGLTTMREKHVEVDGNTVTFSFKGKSGVYHELDVAHPRVAKTIRACLELPGYQLFQYLDEDGKRRVVDSADVNEYLHAHTGNEFSAKHFRTWGGSVLAGDSLYRKGPAETQTARLKNMRAVVSEVSTQLGNTKKVCRTYYIHPAIFESYENDVLIPHFKRSLHRQAESSFALAPEEYATWSLIRNSTK